MYVILRTFKINKYPHENLINISNYFHCSYIISYEQLRNSYLSPNIVRVIKSTRLRWAGYLARMEKGRSAFKILIGIPVGKVIIGRPRSRWEDNNRMNLKEIGINTRN